MAATEQDEAKYRRERSEFEASGKSWERRRAAQIRAEDRERQDIYNQGRRDAGLEGSSKSSEGLRVKSGSPARTIAGTMAFAVLFALISTEIERIVGAPITQKANPEPAIRVMIGGGVATIILVMLSTAGDAGAELAEGLAVVTLVTTLLVKGRPVWDALANLTASKSPVPQPVGNPNVTPVVSSGQYGTSPTTMTNPPLTTGRTQ